MRFYWKYFSFVAIPALLGITLPLAAIASPLKVVDRSTPSHSQGGTQANQLFQDGQQSYRKGYMKAALTQYQKALAIWQALKDRSKEAETLNRIADTLRRQERGPEALKVLNQALALNKALGNEKGVGETLTIMGHTYFFMDDYQKARSALEQALVLHRTYKNLGYEGKTLNILGDIYNSQNQYSKALKLFQQALPLRRLLQDPSEIADSLASFGDVYKSQGRYTQALQYYQQALALFQTAGDRRGQALVLGFIGSIYKAQGLYSKALQQYQQALSLSKELDARYSETSYLRQTGSVYQAQSQYPKAQIVYQQSLSISQEIGYRYGEANSYQKLANLFWTQGRYTQALKTYQLAMQIYKSLDNRPSEAIINTEMGGVYESQNNYKAALVQYQQALAIYQDIKDPWNESRLQGKLGNIYASQQGQYSKAQDIYQLGLQSSQRQNDLSGEASILYLMGDLALSRNRFPEALMFYQQSLGLYEKVEDIGSQASLHSKIGSVYFKQSYFSQALKQYRQALALRQKIGDRTGEAIFLSQSGDIALEQGKYSEAFSFYQRSRMIYQTIGDQTGEAARLIDMGIVSRRQTNYAQAIKFYQQAKAIYRDIEDRTSEAASGGLIGRTMLDLGLPRQALEAYLQVLAIYQDTEAPKDTTSTIKINLVSNNPKGTADALVAIGIVYENYDRYPEALKAYQAAYGRYSEIDNQSLQADTLIGIGRIYTSQQHYEKALESFKESLALYQKAGQRRKLAVSNLQIGTLYRNQKQYTEAISFYQKSLNLSRDFEDLGAEAWSLTAIGRTYALQKQPERAIAFYRQALGIYQKMGDRSSEIDLLSGIAGLLETQKQPELAITFYKQAVNRTEAVRSELRSLPKEQQDSYTKTVADPYRRLADLLLTQGRILEAQQVLELLKVQELRNFTKDTRAGGPTTGIATNPTETQVLKKHGTLILLGQAIRACEVKKCLQYSQLLDEREVIARDYEQSVKVLAQEIKSRATIDDAFLKPGDFKGVAQQILNAQPNTVIIYPLVLENKIWILWVAQGGITKSIEVPQVGQRQLGETVLKFRQLLQDPSSDIAQVKATGKQLYEWLFPASLQKELKENKIRNLIFSLDHVTRYIPMSALYNGNQYLIEGYALSTILTTSLTDTTERLPFGTQKTNVLAVGLSNAVPGFRPLSNVPTELNAIVHEGSTDTQGVYPGVKLLNQAFDRRALRDHMSQSQILHIATHGKFEPGSPDASYLLLGTGEKLPISEIESFRDLGNVHMVVLSACETALGGAGQDGTEIAGISYYFLKGGAKAVVASLWSVDDSSTSLLMQQFYSNLAAGSAQSPVTKAEAMRQAQLKLLQGKGFSAGQEPQRSFRIRETLRARAASEGQGAEGFSHPYYWAPFILIGNGF